MQPVEQAELFLRALSDPLPADGLEALFLFGQTVDNQSATFETAHRLYRETPGLQLLMLAGGARSGYPGFAPWEAALTALGVAPEDIHPLPPADSAILHTRIEAQALMDHLRTKRYTRVGVTAAPFHQVRAFMTAISVALDARLQVELYSCPATPQPLLAPCRHSQGARSARRRDLIPQELERIATYQDKGDIAATQEVLSYLEARERHGR
ncbi:MAG: hypothetical protein QNJ22_08365 [Desulfosarcinaceae bacterium]|nr:hypothetical protein [Desulfosarcinaceae bacterium]